MDLSDHFGKQNRVFSKIDEFQELNETYNTSVGFDLVKCKVYVNSVEWNTLNETLCKATGIIDILSKKTEDHIKYSVADGNNRPLNIDGNRDNGNYSSIIISYRLFSLKLISNNLKGKRDICQLIVHVVPQNDDLGNINNSSCDDLKQRVTELIQFIRDKFGIFLNNNVVTINYFELNRNYFINYNSSDSGNMVTCFIPFFEAAYASLPGKRFMVFPKIVPWGALGVVDNPGIFANSSTVCIHVYNKTIDAEEKSANFLYIDSPHVFRVEFVVKKEKQVESWLSTSNVFGLNQQRIVDAYYKYLNKYVLRSFGEQYNQFYSIMTGEYNTSSRHWTDEFARDLLFYSPKLHINPQFITIDDVKKMLLDMPTSSQTIKQNLGRCVKKIVDKVDKQINDVDYKQIIIDILISPDAEYTIKYYKHK